ncbi:MAG: CPBP family intramembrane glutamic endopeptidase [Verrucomicrobiota bacterium]
MGRVHWWESTAVKLLVFLIGTILLACLLAPPLFWGGKHVVAQGWLLGGPFEGLHGSMDRARFQRYFNRAVLLAVVILIGPTIRWIRSGVAKSDSRQSLRERLLLEPNTRPVRDFALGFGLAAGLLLALMGAYLMTGWYAKEESAKGIFEILLGAFGTALAVAFLEELVFRGAFYALLKPILSGRVVFWTVAIVFAAVHFLQAPHDLDVGAVNWSTGFWLVGAIFAHVASLFLEWDFLLAEFAVLLAIGLVLGWAREITKSLWLPIGLHAGWVFGVKTTSPITEMTFERGTLMPWLGDSLRVGMVSCLIVVITWTILWVCFRKRSTAVVD